MKLNNIKTVYSLANTLYGVSLDETSFEDIVLTGWQLIGNKHTRLYRYYGSTINHELDLPCNLSMIESVTIPFEDAQLSSNLSSTPLYENQYSETYSEQWKWNKSVLYNSGKLITYREENDKLLFDRDYNSVCVLYHGIIVDDEGLPLITDKEMYALAQYVAYIEMYKKALVLKNGDFLQLSQVMKNDWLKSCNNARVPEYVSQNEMNDILDVYTRWDRKSYGKSYKKGN